MTTSNIDNEINKVSDYWRVVEAFLLNYSSRDDVLESDILQRYIDEEEVDEGDLIRIKKEFADDNAVKRASQDLNSKLFYESCKNFVDIYEEENSI